MRWELVPFWSKCTLKNAGLNQDDIDLWELNEAFASQCLYCRDALGIDNEKYNVLGGSISIGHPFGMTGSRQTGLILRELKRRNQKYGVVTMCIGGGQGAAGLFEAAQGATAAEIPVSRVRDRYLSWMNFHR